MSLRLGDIRAGLFARIEQVQDEYAAKGWLPGRLNLNKGVVRGLIELFAWGLWQLYQLLETVHRQAVPLDATGDWLSLHASQIDETRKAATKAVGNILFLRSETASGNIRIPAGRIVRTRTDGEGNVYRYVTTAVAVLPEGQTSVAVPVEAEEYGAASNAAQGQICELATPVPGIGGVTNVILHFRRDMYWRGRRRLASPVRPTKPQPCPCPAFPACTSRIGIREGKGPSTSSCAGVPDCRPRSC